MSQKAAITLPVLFSYECFVKWRWELVDGYLIQSQVGRSYQNVDPWQLREGFLAVAPGDQAVLEYLNRVGYWEEIFPFPATPNDFLAFQQYTRKALLVKSREALSRVQAGLFGTAWVEGIFDPVAVIDWRAEMPVARIFPRTPVEAILTSVVVDRMRGERYGVCARPDCRRIFKFESRHERKYCCTYCAHLEDVRRDRRKAKLAKCREASRRRGRIR
jgi:ribosomal protein L37AE/L43A